MFLAMTSSLFLVLAEIWCRVRLTALGGFINALAQVEFTPPSYGLKRYDPIDATIDDLLRTPHPPRNSIP